VAVARDNGVTTTHDGAAAILVVGADRDVRELVRRALVGAGYRVRAVAGGRAGLAEVEGGGYDLVLLSSDLTDISPVEAVAQVRAVRGDPPAVVVMVSAADRAAVDRLLQADADEYLAQPFDETRLLIRVGGALRAAVRERRLRASERRFQAAAEGSLDALLLLAAVRTPDGALADFRVAEANARAAALVRRPQAALRGTVVGEALPFLAGAPAATWAAVVLSGAPISEQLEVVDERGTARRLYQQVVPLDDGVAVTIRDVTEEARRKEVLARRDEILAAVAFAAERLLADDGERAIDAALARLGGAADVTRILVFENAADQATTTRRYEWCAPGVAPRVLSSGTATLSYAAVGLPRLPELLSRRKVLDQAALPPEEAAVLLERGIQACVCVPVFAGDAWWGFLAFEDGRAPRTWTARELDALRAAADVLGGTLRARMAVTVLREREQLLRGARESSLDAFFLFTSVRGADDRVKDLRFTDLNRRAEELIGRRREDVIGALMGELRPLDRGDGFLARYARVAETGEPLEEEFSIVQPGSGERRWMHQQVVKVGDGVAITTRDVTERTRAEAEEAARRRVATAVARADDPERVFFRAAEEAARLLEADTAAVMRRAVEGAVTVGAWARPGIRPRPPGALTPVPGDTATARALSTGRPARNDRLEDHVRLSQTEGRDFLHSSIAAPIRVGEDVWGALAVASSRAGAFPAGAEERLEHFADLISMAIVNAEVRARLESQARTDPLTGLGNHRVFHERLGEEISRALRHGAPLSLVLLDIDNFKQVNDSHGHRVGDGVLRELARRLAAHAREGDTVARVGGEELAWLLPQTDGEAALTAAERLRAAIEADPVADAGPVTASFGVADLVEARDPSDLYQQADVALYWAKALGRNRCVAYSFRVAEELFSHQSASRLTGSPTMRAMRALAWAVDAKDPYTHRHSERVADLAVALATALGWSQRRCTLMREAGLVHDVGKIAVPDAILFKPDRLTPDEFEQVKAHTTVGATIVADVLTTEQASWVRGHHERWAGGGYPDGLAGDDISEGARILCLADSWDVMTSERSYKAPLVLARAVEEIRRCAGTHFWPPAVEALVRLVECGVIGDRGPALVMERAPTT
jgi:diguanylate cyclase (GGDEF)-like protein/PAS domain S-box-containing protein